MRGVALASVLVLFALAGCMEPSQDDWDAYDSGRGLAFGMALTILLIVGVVVLIVNLTSSGRTGQAEEPAMATPPPATPPPTTPLSGGWETVHPSPEPRKAAAKRSTKPVKPRRPSP